MHCYMWLNIKKSKLVSHKFHHRFSRELYDLNIVHFAVVDVMQCQKMKKLQFLLLCLITNVFHHLAFSRLLVATSVNTVIENLCIQVLLLITYMKTQHYTEKKSSTPYYCEECSGPYMKCMDQCHVLTYQGSSFCGFSLTTNVLPLKISCFVISTLK